LWWGGKKKGSFSNKKTNYALEKNYPHDCSFPAAGEKKEGRGRKRAAVPQGKALFTVQKKRRKRSLLERDRRPGRVSSFPRRLSPPWGGGRESRAQPDRRPIRRSRIAPCRGPGGGKKEKKKESRAHGAGPSSGRGGKRSGSAAKKKKKKKRESAPKKKKGPEPRRTRRAPPKGKKGNWCRRKKGGVLPRCWSKAAPCLQGGVPPKGRGSAARLVGLSRLRGRGGKGKEGLHYDRGGGGLPAVPSPKKHGSTNMPPLKEKGKRGAEPCWTKPHRPGKRKGDHPPTASSSQKKKKKEKEDRPMALEREVAVLPARLEPGTELLWGKKKKKKGKLSAQKGAGHLFPPG